VHVCMLCVYVCTVCAYVCVCVCVCMRFHLIFAFTDHTDFRWASSDSFASDASFSSAPLAVVYLALAFQAIWLTM